MTALKLVTILALAAMTALPSTYADVAQAQPPAVVGSYNPDTQGLTLSWPTDAYPAGTVYTLYRNGYAVFQSTGNVTTRDLGIWLEGVRQYNVTVTLPGLNESVPGPGYLVVKNVQLPGNCQVASLSIYTRPPGASYTIYDECIPR